MENRIWKVDIRQMYEEKEIISFSMLSLEEVSINDNGLAKGSIILNSWYIRQCHIMHFSCLMCIMYEQDVKIVGKPNLRRK